jgi:ATP-binding cassette, subfamily F, member 3
MKTPLARLTGRSDVMFVLTLPPLLSPSIPSKPRSFWRLTVCWLGAGREHETHAFLSMEAEIKTLIPGIDPVLSEYSVGYLTHASNAYSPSSDASGPTQLSEAISTISALLISASGDSSPANELSIQKLVEKLVSSLSAAEGGQKQVLSTARKLEQTFQVGSQRNVSSTLGLAGGSVDLESANTRKVESRVDRKKLEKAERKIRAKQDKKVMKNVEYEASKLIDQPDEAQSYEEFFMAVNPLQLGTNAAGAQKSKDVKVDGVDVSIGGKRILSDTSLTLAYGRRYGLVGQNGIGKSTLLRALSRREVAIPTHITILHVEQEVSHSHCLRWGRQEIWRLAQHTPKTMADHYFYR